MKRWTVWAPLAGALAAAGLVQGGALRAPFFADDWLFLDQVRPRGFLAALTSPDPIGNFVRPLGRVIWFWTLGRASAESAFVFHAANLALWVIAVGLVWAIAQRLAGPRVAAIAAALFAITHAADVPVWWTCGSQDLLALALALGSMLAFLSGRKWTAAALLFLAPFAKETIAVAIVPAVLLAREPGEPWRVTLRRAAPLGAALAAWAIAVAIVFAKRHAPASGMALSAWGLPAAIVNAARTAIGLEWRAGSPPWVPFVLPGPLEGGALLLAAITAAWLEAPARARPAAREPAKADRAGSRRRGASPARAPGAAPPSSAAARTGAAQGAAARPPGAPPSPRPAYVALAWVLPAALPVALVGPTWSSYYFLFACAGFALAAGLLLAKASRLEVLTVVLLVGLGMQQARTLDEFATAPSPWSAQSHVNRFYIQRGMSVMSDCVVDLKRKYPTLPPRSTVYFGSIPAFAAVQVADGPLLRGVYRDTTLRSHYINSLDTEVLKRGPYFIMLWDNAEHQFTDRTHERDLWLNLGLGYVLNANPTHAAMAFEMDLKQRPGSRFDRYALALTHAELGDTATANRMLVELGFSLGRSAEAMMKTAVAQIQHGDTNQAIVTAATASVKAVYDPFPHRFLGTLLAADTTRASSGILEAYAAVALAPQDAVSWRLWGALQAEYSHEPEALRSLERYFKLDPTALTRDSEARMWRDALRERLPGGHVTQSSLKNELRGF